MAFEKQHHRTAELARSADVTEASLPPPPLVDQHQIRQQAAKSRYLQRNADRKQKNMVLRTILHDDSHP